MTERRPGKSIGAKLARSLCAQFAGARDAELEQVLGASSRHQVFALNDGRVVEVFLKSARLYDSKSDFLANHRKP